MPKKEAGTRNSRLQLAFVYLGIVLGTLLIGVGATQAVQVGNDEVIFEKVRRDFQNPGQSTWFYTVISGSSPAISHTTFQLNLDCLNVEDTGTWTDFDTLNSGDGSPSVGSDPQTGDLTGVKFDDGFTSDESRGYYITVDGNYAEGTITVATKAGPGFDTASITGPSLSCSLPSSDLTASKTNDATNDEVQLGDSFEWTVTVTNSGSADATFSAGEAVLGDDLPSGPTYGAPTVSTSGGVSGSLACSISSDTLTCTADGGSVTIPSGASISATFSVTPNATGTLTNSTSTCADPNDVMDESDETNNDCGDTVDVGEPKDSDGDGIPDEDEGDGDRDDDGIPNKEDPDPRGYFYCRDTGEILDGGSISVSGPAPANIVNDGSSGEYDFTVSTPGTYTIVFSAPPDTTIDTSFEKTTAFDPTGMSNPVVLGPGEDGNSGFLSDEPEPFPTDYFTTFELETGDPIVINNNVPLVGPPCEEEPAVGGDPPLWGDHLIFPTPETFLGRDLNGDADTRDAVLRIKNVRTGRVRNTGVPVSNRHRAVDLYQDTAVFVTQESSLQNGGGLFNLWGTLRTDEGPIGVLNVETGEVRMLDVWGARPTVHENIVTISGSTLRYYDLAEDRLVNTGQPGTHPAVWDDWIVYERKVDGVPRLHLYHLETGGVQSTGIAGAYPAIHEGTIAFSTDESWINQDLNGDGDQGDTVVRAYDIAQDRVINTGQSGQDPAIYGDRIAFNQGRSILYHDLSTGQTYATGQQGAEPDIYQDRVTSYVWESWIGTDVNADRDRDDPIVQTHQVSHADRVLPQPQLTTSPQPDPLSLKRVFSYRQANGVRINAQGQGIERVTLRVYNLSGNPVAQPSSPGTQLTWRLSTDQGQRVANGVYLYVVTASGRDGQAVRSEVRKLVVLH